MLMKIGGSALELVLGDITLFDADAIVNPANMMLQMGGGVAGAILRRGGKSIQRECDAIGHISVGEAVLTSGGNLKAGHVVHAVGPRMGEGDEDEKLKNAVLNSLLVATEHNIKTIAFPAISTGIFGYPMDRCATIMLDTVIGFLKGNNSIKKVTICLYDMNSYKIFINTFEGF